MKFNEISNSVVVCQDSSYYLVNSCCVNLGKEIIFVDTCLDIKLATEFRTKMVEKFNPEKETLIITHSNGDHFYAIQAYKEVPVVVCEELYNTSRAENFKNKLRFNSIQTFSKEIVFGPKKNELIFRLVGGHTSDSIYGYFPSERILIAGDNLLSNMPQYFPFEDSNLEKWVKCLKSWEQLDIDIVVVGHGNPVDKTHITKVRTFFEKLNNVLVQSKNEGLSINQVLKHPDLPIYFEEDPEGWIESGIRQNYKNILQNKERTKGK